MAPRFGTLKTASITQVRFQSRVNQTKRSVFPSPLGSERVRVRGVLPPMRKSAPRQVASQLRPVSFHGGRSVLRLKRSAYG